MGKENKNHPLHTVLAVQEPSTTLYWYWGEGGLEAPLPHCNVTVPRTQLFLEEGVSQLVVRTLLSVKRPRLAVGKRSFP